MKSTCPFRTIKISSKKSSSPKIKEKKKKQHCKQPKLSRAPGRFRKPFLSGFPRVRRAQLENKPPKGKKDDPGRKCRERQKKSWHGWRWGRRRCRSAAHPGAGATDGHAAAARGQGGEPDLAQIPEG